MAKINLDKKFKKQKKPNASENNSTTAKVKNEKSYSVFIFSDQQNLLSFTQTLSGHRETIFRIKTNQNRPKNRQNLHSC